VVPEVPLPGESMSGLRALTTLVGAEVGLLAVAVHGVGLTLVTEQASSRRETGILASLDLAAVGLQVGINKLVVVALELLGPVVASGLALPWAVEKAIGLGIGILVQNVVPGRLTLATETARAKRRGKRETILRHGRHNIRSHKVIHLLGNPAARRLASESRGA